MRDIDDLRRALDEGTAHLALELPPDQIRQRVRRVRNRRRATLAAVAAVTVGALVVPGVLFGHSPRASTVDGVGSPTGCPGLADAALAPPAATLGPLVDTGATLEAPNLGTQFDVLIGVSGPSTERPAFTIAFHDRGTGAVDVWDMTMLGRDSYGDLLGQREGEGSHQFMSQQLVLGPGIVLDVGLYTRSTSRVTVTAGGTTTVAQTRLNSETGWTLFWAQHAVAAADQGSAHLTLTGYGLLGVAQHTVTGGPLVGGSVHNPRDNPRVVPGPSGTEMSLAMPSLDC